MEKNYGFQTREQELEYVRTFTLRKYDELARELEFMKTIISIVDDKDYTCFIGLMSSIETMFQCNNIRESFFNYMMNELYNITLLTMSDEQYQRASRIANI